MVEGKKAVWVQGINFYLHPARSLVSIHNITVRDSQVSAAHRLCSLPLNNMFYNLQLI